ncbi:MAG: DUF1566 domain-containing protein [Deltaproteobacteria bacterium]|nr:DUF1566 domain-containing protein [Deltaproteobacteria bacterium]
MSASTRWMIATVVVFLTWSPALRASAPSGRFTVFADTVKDEVTGLTWQRAVSATVHTQSSASAYCQSLNLGGSSAWRLPTVKELTSIVDRRASLPAIDGTVFPNTEPSDWFWTSSVCADSAGYVWAISFEYGDTFRAGVASDHKARCVR